MKLPKFNQKGITHILGLLLFVGIFAAIGGIYLYISHAAPVTCACGGGGAQTQTEYFNGASGIIPAPYSTNYSLVNDYLGNDPVTVALVNAGGQIEFGGKGGGTTPTPIAQQLCYVMKSPKGANVSVIGLNGGQVALRVKPWPYQAGPVPYQHSCVTNGDSTRTGITFKVVSGGPVYFYGEEVLVTYPY